MTEAICAALVDKLATEHEHILKPQEVAPTVLSTVLYRFDYRYGMSQAGAREYFCPCYGRLQSAFGDQEGGQKRRASAGGHHGDPTCMLYRCDSLPVPDPGSTLATDLKDIDVFSCGCSGEKICRLCGSRPCVFVNVGVRHRCQQAKFRIQAATFRGERMPTLLKGKVVFVAVEAKLPGFSEAISAR